MKRYFFLVGILQDIIWGGYTEPDKKILFEYVNPPQKIFPKNGYFPPAEALADVARGENASLFVVKGSELIKDLKISVKPLINDHRILSEIMILEQIKLADN
jgi:hypothetical protein